MNNEDFINDIRMGITKLRHAFERHGLTPTGIELGSWEDGNALKHNLPIDYLIGLTQGIDPKSGVMVNQVEIDGIIVRWPAIKKARFGGGFDYI